MVQGGAWLGRTHHPDVFPLRRPLAMCGERCSRHALAAIAWEYARGSVASGRAEPGITKRREAYEAAKAAAEAKIRRYDACWYLWAALRQAWAWFDSEGRINDLTARQAEIEAILALRRELGCEKRTQERKSCAAGLAGYWGYEQRAEEVYRQLRARSPCAVVQALACGWPLQKQATTNKDYGLRKHLTQAAEYSFDYAASLLPEPSEAIRQDVTAALDAEVRRASLVEHVNAALRPLLETCRGQVDQARLELCA